MPGSKSKVKSPTPDKKLAPNMKSSLINSYSSKKKESQFETPKATLSQVKLKHESGKNEAARVVSSIGAGTNEDSKSDVRRRLVMKNITHSSIA